MDRETALYVLKKHGTLPDVLAEELPDEVCRAFYELTSMVSHRGDGMPTQHRHPEAVRKAAVVLMLALLRKG